MMNELQIANVLQGSVVLALGSVVFFRFVPTCRLDAFRQRMFAVRDGLFDFAADGHIAFDDPAYVLLRLQMNGMIRYGHQLTLFRSIMGSAIKSVSGDSQTMPWHASWEAALVNIKDESVRARMVEFHDRSVVIAAKHLIYGSPTLWVALFLAALGLVATGAALGLKQVLRAAALKVLSGPLDQRLIEEDAVGAFAW